jgi:DNA-binding transcriptional MerR regulator
MSGLTRRRIRYYESLGLLRPARTPGGRRLYSPADLGRLAEVKDLLEAGLELRAIVTLAREGDLPEVSAPGKPVSAGASVEAAGSGRKGTLDVAHPRTLDVEGIGAFEDARARLLGRGPGGSLDRLYPGEAGRFGAGRLGGQPASWLRLPVRPAGPLDPAGPVRPARPTRSDHRKQ